MKLINNEPLQIIRVSLIITDQATFICTVDPWNKY